MTDPRVKRLADLLTNYCVAVKPGDRVLITGGHLALPLIRETYRQVLRAGGNPMLQIADDEIQEILFKEASDDQLKFVHEPVKVTYDTFECQIGIRGAANTRAMSGVDPKKQHIRQTAQKGLSEIFMRRSAAGELRWVGTLYPTPAYAQDADMSLSDFEDFVYGACHVDKEDPVAEWMIVSEEQRQKVEWLKGKKQVKIKGPSVELTLSIIGRTFINSDGKRNMPSGEIFTGPVEDSVNGWVRFTYPAIVSGREISGVELRFENGKVIQASAEKNEEFLHSALESDEGARYLGEFAIGTNFGINRFTKNILYDEKIGGTIHMALGAGYPETGSKNKSSIHWDMICEMRDGGQIWVDDELFYDTGEFKV